ncbi:MAG: class I SAM-dependent methyltransferase [Candidatus Omnitrophica bacterium]|nr:class I SAM-dependent methyltransferase [Candidatus Omnitrophota bacterium]
MSWRMMMGGSQIRREMDKRYWDGMACAYEEEIHSVLHCDRQGVIEKRLRKIASVSRTVADIGCGIGHFLPILSKYFKRVYANDISEDLLARAQADHEKLPNITFLAGDIRSAFKKIPRVDCVVSVNSLISSSMSIRHKMLEAMAKILKPDGSLVLVVPSLESSLFVDLRFVQWKWKDGSSFATALRSVYVKDPLADNKARQGILGIDGVATKHYLKEELCFLLKEAGLDVKEVVKIEYGWDTEFERVPRWMGAPYPWDWLVIAQRGRR